jgi:hypothetical protein
LNTFYLILGKLFKITGYFYRTSMSLISMHICILLKDSPLFSYTFSAALFRAAESTEEVSSLRPPRLIQEDGIIRPYDRQESEGYDLFEVNSVHGHE